MRMSTLFRDLALKLEMTANDLDEAGPSFREWRQHLLNDCQSARDFAAELRKDEPPLPSIADVAGSMPDFTGGLSTEDYLRQIR